MTIGERMVWAAEYVRRIDAGSSYAVSACWAARAVESLQQAQQSTALDPPARRMLEDMLETKVP